MSEIQSQTKPDDRQYLIQHAEYLSTRLLPLNSSDKRLLTLACVILVYVTLTGGSIFYWLLIPIITYLLLRKVLKGRPYRVFLNFWKGQWIVHVRKGVIWSSEYTTSDGQSMAISTVSSEPQTAQKAVKSTKKSKATQPEKVVTGPIPLEINPLGDVALIYNTIAKTDSIVFVGDGSSFMGETLDGQYNFIQSIARMARDVTVANSGYKLSTSWGLMKRPPDRYQRSQDLAEGHHPEALALALAQKRGTLDIERLRYPGLSDSHFQRLLWCGLDMLEQIELSSANDADITMFTTWTIRRDKLIDKASKGGSLAEDEVNDSAIAELATTVKERLASAGVVNPKVLDLADARRFVNSALNITHIDDYHRWAKRFAQAANETAEEIKERLEQLPNDGHLSLGEAFREQSSPHWPQYHIKEFSDYAVIDDTYIATLALTEHPKYTWPHFRSELEREFDNALGGEGIRWYSITDIGETVSSKSQVWRMNVSMPLVEHFTQNIRDIPQVRDQRSQQEEQRTSYYREGYTTDSSTLITLLGSTQEQLTKYIKTAKAICQRMGLGPKHLTGASRQLPAALCQIGIPML